VSLEINGSGKQIKVTAPEPGVVNNYVCSKCGFISQLSEFFIQTRSPLFVRKPLCPKCWASRRPAIFPRVLKFLGIPVLICGLLALPGPFHYIAEWILLVLVFLVVSPIYLVPHEAGHAIAGKLLGYRIFSVTIGAGPVIWSRRIGGTDFEWRILPTKGFVIAAPTFPTYSRIKAILFHAVGPLTNAVISMILIWAAVHYNITFEHLGARALPLYLSLLPNIWGFIFSLWPTTGWIQGKRVPTDGLRILRALFSSKPSRQDFSERSVLEASYAMASGEYKTAEYWAEDAVASEVHPGAGRFLLASLRLLQGQAEAARDLLRPFVEIGKLGQLGNDAAFLMGYTALLVATQGAYDEASAMLDTVVPGSSDPKLDAIRACLLIATGQVETGLHICHCAFANPLLDRHILPDLACFLAEGENARGNLREAGIYSQIAREMGANSRFLCRIEGVLP
jgi:hypothetical protein